MKRKMKICIFINIVVVQSAFVLQFAIQISKQATNAYEMSPFLAIVGKIYFFDVDILIFSFFSEDCNNHSAKNSPPVNE